MHIRKKIFILMALLSIPLISNGMNQAARIAEDIARSSEEWAREQQRTRERIALRGAQAAAEIAELRAQGIPATDQRIINLQMQVNRAEKDADRFDSAVDTANSIVSNAMQAGIGMFTTEQKKNEETNRIRQQGLVDGHNAMNRLKFQIEQLKNPENLKKALLFLGGATIVTIGGYYTIKITAGQVEKYLNKPNIVRESSRKSFSQSIKKFFYALINGQEEEADLSQMVFSPTVERVLYRLAEDTKQMHEYKLPYENAVFYGPPGTGKTEFAKLLARYSDLDYAICSASDIKTTEQLRELFEWANASDGMVIFLDEAELILGDRSKCTNPDTIAITNTFLSFTGSQSDKFAVYIATNYPNKLDSAVRSRFPHVIEFALPVESERVRIINSKVQRYLANDIREYEKDGETIIAGLSFAANVTNEYFANLAKQMDGFSGRDIDQLINAIRLRSYRSGDNIVTREIIEEALNAKIEKVKKDRLIDLQQNCDDTAKLNKLMGSAAAA